MAKKDIKKEKGTDLDSVLDKYKGVLRKGSDQYFKYGRIPFGIGPLDKLLNGGIPKKRITILIGQPSAGKSYLASQVVKQVQLAGEKAIWIDTELSWDSEWMAKCGVNSDDVDVIQPESGEQAFGVVRDTMNAGVGLVVLDSVAGLIPSVFNDEDFSYNPMAWQARLVNQGFPRLIPSLSHGAAFLVINQLRAGMGKYAADVMPGGEAQSFFAHFKLDVRRGEWIEDTANKKEKVGFNMEIIVRKTKVGGQPLTSCVVPFMFNGGFDMVELVIREAINKDIIKQSGPYYKVGDMEEKLLGMPRVKQYLLDNPEVMKEIESKVVL